VHFASHFFSAELHVVAVVSSSFQQSGEPSRVHRILLLAHTAVRTPVAAHTPVAVAAAHMLVAVAAVRTPAVVAAAHTLVAVAAVRTPAVVAAAHTPVAVAAVRMSIAARTAVAAAIARTVLPLAGAELVGQHMQHRSHRQLSDRLK
jgi:hypothetical protein